MDIPIKYLQIQTIEKCNLKCSFCPNSYVKQSEKKMTKKLFNKILDDLGDYKGSFALHLMNEPTLDKRIPEFVETISKRFPGNRIYLSTNGTLVDEEYLLDLFNKGLTELSISCYSQAILDRYKHLSSDKIKVHNFIKEPEGFYNRAGNVKVGSEMASGYCERPFEVLCIKWNGKAVLCCSDYKNEVVMGDLNKNTPQEVFNKFKKYREHLSKGLRDLPLCKGCNYVSNKLR